MIVHSESMSLDSTAPSDWFYVSEGGATIVFRYCGPINQTFDAQVIRLKKRSRRGDAEIDNVSNAEIQARGVTFQDRIISAFIPEKHLPRLLVVKVSKRWLEALRDVGENYRPQPRRQADGIDLSSTAAIVAPDLIGTQGWSIEIKVRLYDT